MNAITQSEKTALTLPERAAVALGAAEHEIKLRELVKSSADIVAVIDPAGREQAHRIGMTLKNARVSIEKTGKAAREDATAFSKAVIAEEKRLVDIVTGEENRVFGLRDTFDAAEQARKDALIATERARTDTIQAMIQKIRNQPVGLAGKSAAGIAAWLDAENPDKDFDFMEFSNAAADAIAESLIVIRDMLSKAKASEAAALAAEEARQAEAARIEQERATLAAQRAENERIANEQAAERQRLADQQAAQERAAKELADKAAANLRAEREALEEAMRLEREKAAKEQAERDRVAADLKRQLDEQQAAIAAERAAFLREQEEARKRIEDAVKMDLAHTEALIDNATFDDAMTRLAAVDTPTFHVGQSDDLARCNATVAALRADNLPRPESCCASDARIDSGDDPEVTDDEITEMGAEWGLNKPALIVRLRKYIADSEVA